MKKNFSNGSQVLLGLFENGKSPLSEQFVRWKLWARWGEIVGPSIANVCEPVALKDGTLFIWVKSSVWMQQLSFMKDALQKKIQGEVHAGVIRRVRFTLNQTIIPAEERENFRENISKLSGNSDSSSER